MAQSCHTRLGAARKDDSSVIQRSRQQKSHKEPQDGRTMRGGDTIIAMPKWCLARHQPTGRGIG